MTGSRQSRVGLECGSKLPHSIGASHQRRCAILHFRDFDVTLSGMKLCF